MALALGVSFGAVKEGLVQVLYARRVELPFLLFFALAYSIGYFYFAARRQEKAARAPTKAPAAASVPVRAAQRHLAPPRTNSTSQGAAARARPPRSPPDRVHQYPAPPPRIPASAPATPARPRMLQEEWRVELAQPRGLAAEQRVEAKAEPMLEQSRRAADDLVELCQSPGNWPQIMKAYRAARLGGLVIDDLSREDCQRLFKALVTAAIQGCRSEDALQLLRELRSEGPGADAEIIGSAVKLLSTKGFFKDCLSAYDGGACSALASGAEGDYQLWSNMLWCAAEEKHFERCGIFFGRLKAVGTPSAKDFCNIFRFASAKNDAQFTLQLYHQMRDVGVDIDNAVCNAALTALAAAGEFELAGAFLEDVEAGSGAADIASYNILAKGLSKAGRMDDCLVLFERMHERGISPTQMSYGILFEGYIHAKQVDRAAEVYKGMLGVSMNMATYAILMKGFARAGRVEQAMRVYAQMRADPASRPDIVTIGILIKAMCDARQLDPALQLFKDMPDLHLVPDEIIYNNLICGCAAVSKAEVAEDLYRHMLASGVRPSSTTFSVLIRLYMHCKRVDEAFQLLRSEPKALGMCPEPRLFTQLINALLRDRSGHRAVSAYALMLQYTMPSASENTAVLALCIKLNMLESAVEILDLVSRAQGSVRSADAAAVLDTCWRKQKVQLAESCRASMQRLGIGPTSGGGRRAAAPRHAA